MSKDGGVVCDH